MLLIFQGLSSPNNANTFQHSSPPRKPAKKCLHAPPLKHNILAYAVTSGHLPTHSQNISKNKHTKGTKHTPSSQTTHKLVTMITSSHLTRTQSHRRSTKEVMNLKILLSTANQACDSNTDLHKKRYYTSMSTLPSVQYNCVTAQVHVSPFWRLHYIHPR